MAMGVAHGNQCSLQEGHYQTYSWLAAPESAKNCRSKGALQSIFLQVVSPALEQLWQLLTVPMDIRVGSGAAVAASSSGHSDLSASQTIFTLHYFRLICSPFCSWWSCIGCIMQSSRLFFWDCIPAPLTPLPSSFPLSSTLSLVLAGC